MSKPKRTITEYRNYYLPPQFPVLLLSGDFWKISDIPSGRLHFHNCMEIGVCHSDGGTMEFFGQKMHFKAGDVTCVPRNVPHTTYSDKGTESHWSYLFVDQEAILKVIAPNSWKNYDLSIQSFKHYKHILSQNEYPTVYMLTVQIITELEEKRSGYQLSVRGLLLALFIELLRIQSDYNLLSEPTEESPENALIISPALDYIENNYMHPVTMEQLANTCHWSVTHFRRIFHEIMGVSPLEYVNNTRIMKACLLLRSTDISILEISENVGFHSISSFNRYFFKVCQSNPREYKRIAAQAEKRSEKLSILEYAGWMAPESMKNHSGD